MPIADTAQTFAKWRIGKGPYIVVPLIGPSTLREVVGYVGDSALNPVSWITTAFGAPTAAIAIPSTNTNGPVELNKAGNRRETLRGRARWPSIASR